MKKRVIITVTVVCLALFGLAIAGGTGWDGRRHTPEEKIAYLKFKIADTLDLDEAQKATLDRIAEEVLVEHQQMAADRDAFKAALMETLRKERVDPQELQRLFETKKPAIDNLMQMAAGHIAQFHSILTPAQRETLVAKIEAHQGGRCRLFH